MTRAPVTAVAFYAGRQCILKPMPRSALVVLAVSVLLAGCSTSVRFINATPGTPREIPAELFRPVGDGPFPAVVLLHGCQGVSDTTRQWGRWFSQHDYVALVIDSWTPRGIGRACLASEPELPSTERFDDSVGALRLLRGLSFVDGARVGTMGWSSGGVFAMAVINGGSLARASARGVTMPEPGYRAAVAIYPGGCQSLASEAVVKPLLVLAGEADDWTPARFCVEMVEAMRGKGAPASIIVYPGAFHYFDVEGLARTFLPDVGNDNRPGGAGATVSFDAEASADAHRQVEAFFARHLRDVSR
jgi:dienelactone hydrolase